MVQAKKAVKSVTKANIVAKVITKKVVNKLKDVSKPVVAKVEAKVVPVVAPKAKAVKKAVEKKKVVLTPILPAKGKALFKEEVKKVATNKFGKESEKGFFYWNEVEVVEIAITRRLICALTILANKKEISYSQYIENLIKQEIKKDLAKPLESKPNEKKSKAKK